jgi:hypothetical protein
MFGSDVVVTDNNQNIYAFNAENITASSVLKPTKSLSFDLASIQNFIYREKHYLVGVRNQIETDALVIVDLTNDCKIINEIQLEFKV